MELDKLNRTIEMNREETRNQLASALLQLLRDVGNHPQLADVICVQ